ncbi:MAG: cytochrome b/b6 domain-containing protein, partial [Acidimicrobiia bacterium]|nr:cytochrome b/b6 domain-containing protein [Acidimicrobiia bacterium]
MTSSAQIRRFTVSDRAEHWAQMITFTVLAITGIVQRYEGAWISERLIDLMGGIESTRNIHRVFATILMVAVVYHFGSAGYRRFVRKEPRSMVPGALDARAVWSSIKFSLGRTDKLPQQGRFTWEEKVEYWAFLWGTVVMVITGFLLWNPIATAKFLPGELIPTAQAAHGGEAVLAVLAIVVWHVYHVHVRHFNKSMYGGTMSRSEMEEFHPLELASMDAGEYSPPSPEDRNRRLVRFLPAYGMFAIVLLVGVYAFVSFEDTAIATIEPQEQTVVFVPVETLATTTTT